jgi:MFS transporter, YNFM family, putative membrane transport protein
MSNSSTTRAILLLGIASFASTCAFRVLDPALMNLSETFDITTGEAAHVMTWFAVAYGVMQFFYGPIGDRFGKYRTVATATLACAVGNYWVAIAPTFDLIVVGRFLSGAAAAGIIPMSMAWIGDHVPYEKRQETLAKFSIGMVTGMGSGLVLGGMFADTLGWRASFYFLGSLYLVVGTLLISQRGSMPDLKNKSQVGFELLTPIKGVIAIPWARVVLGIVLIEGALVFGALSFVPSYLQMKHEISSTMAGLITGLYSCGALIYVMISKWVIKRLGESHLVQSGGVILALSYIIFLWVPGWQFAMLASVMCGLGYYFMHAVLQTLATQMAPERRGTAVALFASFLFAGQAIGITLGAQVVDQFGLGSVFIFAILLMPLIAYWFAHKLNQRRISLAASSAK